MVTAWVCIATLVDSDTETEEIAGFGESLKDAFWDMANSQSPIRNFATHALFERYTRNMGNGVRVIGSFCGLNIIIS